MYSARLIMHRSTRIRISPKYAMYHTFPDPNEKPVITTSISEIKKQLDKSKLDISLDDTFKMHNQFPDFNNYNKSISNVNTKTLSTTLKNGLVVASEDRYSLMTSLAFVVKTGR